MEFKTKGDYDYFLKGNEQYLSAKIQDGKFELFVCNECLSHFDNKQERDEHLESIHGWDHHPSASIDDSDFKNGGTVFN